MRWGDGGGESWWETGPRTAPTVSWFKCLKQKNQKHKTTEHEKRVPVLLMLEVHGGFPAKCRSQHKAQEGQQSGGRVMSAQFIQGSEGNGSVKRENNDKV